MNTKLPECWDTDPKAHGLRIEIAAGHTFFLPFDQLVFAELKNEGKDQHLRLVFATHEVLIHGYALRRIEIAMQRRELSFVSKLPSTQRDLIDDGHPMVLEIAVTEVKS